MHAAKYEPSDADVGVFTIGSVIVSLAFLALFWMWVPTEFLPTGL